MPDRVEGSARKNAFLSFSYLSIALKAIGRN
jgi:hypothetical protein